MAEADEPRLAFSAGEAGSVARRTARRIALTPRGPDAIKFPIYSVAGNRARRAETSPGGLVEAILRQVVNLVVASLPTTIIVFLFYLFARSVFFNPMMRVLDERAARTEGARSEAARLDSQAEERLALYRRSLDRVRAGIYAEQEIARRAALDQRAELLRQARTKANARVREEKQRIEGEVAGAAEQVDRETRRLAEEAARVVLAAGAPAPERAGEA